LLELPDSLRRALEAGGTVAVPSRQRATALRLAYAESQLRQQRAAWTTPSALSWTEWLEREYSRAAETHSDWPRVLRSSEEWLLWRSVVARESQSLDNDLGHFLVDALRRSSRLLAEWRIPLSAIEQYPTPEGELLVRAMRQFEARCAEMQAIPAARVPEFLLDASPSQDVIFAGFIGHSRVRDALMKGGARGASYEPLVAAKTRLRSFETLEDETTRAALWCREQLESDPHKRLLVVFPDLMHRRHAIARSFEQALSPQATLGSHDLEVTPLFTIEGGRPLGDYPLVRQALTTLQLLTSHMSFEDLGPWLRSPFWRTPGIADRSRLELRLRTVLRPEVDAVQLLNALNVETHSASAIRTLIENAQSALGENDAAAQLWPRRLLGALDALGWPGSRPLSSAEQQTRTRFIEMVNEVAALAPVLGVLSPRQAVSELRYLIARAVFEPASGDASVTLTDTLGDPVVRYDGVWVAGLHADVWPQPARFDPFIPYPVQRTAGIPTADPAALLGQARQTLGVWQHSTSQLILSWPEHNDDREYLPSPLLSELRGIEPEKRAAAAKPRTLAMQLRGKTSLQSYQDWTGTSWNKDNPLPAGTRSIELQSQCAFRAYGELRLAAVPLETPYHGIDPRARGQLMHGALELLWQELRDSQGLQSCDDATLSRLVEQCVAKAATKAFHPLVLDEQARVISRELRRARRLILQLCALERQRPPFRVARIESKHRVSLVGAQLDIRIDRVDELTEGESVIFDYKTGKPKPQDWQGERVANPQLLVYLQALVEPVVGMATVHLVSARVGYRGIADRKGRLPRVDALKSELPAEEAWADQLLRWRGHVEQLARDFLTGRAVADPMPQACRICHLHAVCRIADINENLASVLEPDGLSADD